MIIPYGVTSIGYDTFFNCGKLTSVTIPDSVNSIGDGAFALCRSLTSVTIPNNVTSIGESAFQGCTSLTGVTIPDGVTSIEKLMFYGCTGLTSVTIPTSVTRFEKSAFRGCTGLTSVIIPGSVTSIGDFVFDECTSLTDIYYGGSEAQWNAAVKDSMGVYDASVTTVHFNAAPAPEGLTDLKDWSKAPVNWAVDNKFADAKSASVFGSDDPCPRWEVVDILWKAMGSPEPSVTSSPFADVSPDAPYYKAILWAYEKGIALGKEYGFGPNDTVKRCEALTFLWRAANKPTAPRGTSFKDVPNSAYYIDAISWAVSRSTPIANGTDFNVFSPNDPVTRAQMVTFLYRWLVENK